MNYRTIVIVLLDGGANGAENKLVRKEKSNGNPWNPSRIGPVANYSTYSNHSHVVRGYFRSQLLWDKTDKLTVDMSANQEHNSTRKKRKPRLTIRKIERAMTALEILSYCDLPYDAKISVHNAYGQLGQLEGSDWPVYLR